MIKILKIKNFNDYYITNNGDIYSRKNNRFIKLKTDTNTAGYLRVCLYLNKKSYHKFIHRL